MRKTFVAGLVVVAGLLAAASVGAQSTADFVPAPAQGQQFELSIRNIMRAEENVGVAPSQIRWTDDSQWVYFRWRPGGLAWDAETSSYRVRADGSGLEKLTDEEVEDAAVSVANGDLSADRRWRVSSVSGDLWLVDRQTMDARRLTETQDNEGQPLFSADGEAIFFRRDNNLFRFELETGELEQVTFVSDNPEPRDEPEAEGQKAFLEQQQLELFEHVRREAERRERAEERREEAAADRPATVYLNRGERLQGLTPTRDGAYVVLQAFTSAQGDTNTVVPDWVTANGYTRDINGRAKVGDVQSTSRAGILTAATGEVNWIEAAPDDYDGEGTPRVYNAGWNDAGTTAYVFAVSFDDKDRWLWSVDAATGEQTLLDHLHDDAWVGGPCFASCVGFLPGSDRVYFVSEETGYAQLYAINADGTGKQALTAGEWEVLDVDIPEQRDHFLLRTSEGSPFNENVYRMSFDGGERIALTSGDGRYVATPAPNGERFALVHDVANRPPELYLADTGNMANMEKVTDSPTAAWQSFPWIKPEIIRFAAEDGTMVPARIYRPNDMGAEANGAGILFVHGAGYLHNVHNYWSSYYREYQFNQFLAAAGYTVLDVDYRGSAGYGAAWRTAIYRWMGGKDLSDQVDGARYLVEQEGVDPQRIGLYGGSYGGFITLMGLFTAPDTFKSGAALRSVTDWAHYNHGYTSEILNLPQEDEEAYERSSPIYFAENFRPDQHLVMLHGMVDTNVHFSDVVRLTQRLIELGKENWELAVYPVESHGFVEPTSWTDEYRRIFELFDRTLREPGCTDDGGLCAVRQGTR
ncbi:MAG: prolyl oligopeptidase family serine peptidase [Acidobacteriota bacterium]|jgi:dipeptidyl aminopeptidase/acylaminoacyl peptidase